MLIVCSQAFATTYYVNSSTGSNSNPGTLVSPFQYMSAVTGTNFLKPGDVVNIASGTTYTGSNCSFTINSSGQPYNPITINGVGTTPIFNCATNTSAVSGWTGWNFYEGTDTFTVTSANATAGATYTNNGATFTVVTTISGGTTLETTLTSGTPSSSGTLTLASGTGDSTITFSSVAVTYAVYKSQTTVPFNVNGVIIDGTYSLISRQTSGMLNKLSNAYYTSGGYVYVDLPDNSVPSGHTVEFVGSNYGAVDTGQVQTNGNYINFNNIEAYGAYSSNWLIVNKYINVSNSYGYFSAYSSFYCANSFQPVGCYNSTFTNDTGEYASSGNYAITGGSNGENVVIEGSYNVWNGGLIAYGTMAGMDVINYEADTPGSYNKVINTTIEYNSQRALQNADYNGYDPQFYCDGCNNLIIANDIIIGNVQNSTFTYSTQNAIFGISLSSEHPAISHPHDIYVLNNTIDQNKDLALVTTILYPNYYFTIPSSSVTSGAVYSITTGGIVYDYDVTTTIAGGTLLTTHTGGTGGGALPAATGTLTLVSGTGPSTISYTAFTQNQFQWYNVFVSHNTIYSDYLNGGDSTNFTNFNTTTTNSSSQTAIPVDGTSLHLYNNLFYQNSGSPAIYFDNTGMIDANYNAYYSVSSSAIFKVGYYPNQTSYSLSGWQSASSQDANSIGTTPYIVSTTLPYDFHLQRTASGQSNNSPLVAAGEGSWDTALYNISSFGTTNSTGAIDSSFNDIGYHYNMVFNGLIGFPNGQVGTDYN